MKMSGGRSCLLITAWASESIPGRKWLSHLMSSRTSPRSNPMLRLISAATFSSASRSARVSLGRHHECTQTHRGNGHRHTLTNRAARAALAQRSAPGSVPQPPSRERSPKIERPRRSLAGSPSRSRRSTLRSRGPASSTWERCTSAGACRQVRRARVRASGAPGDALDDSTSRRTRGAHAFGARR